MNASPLLALLVFASSAFAQVPYPGNDSDHGPVMPEGFLNPYTGNIAYATNDLIVAGAVGKYGLAWKRYGNSRTIMTEPLFGRGHNWSHSWQYEMADEGQDDQGQSVVSLRLPRGQVLRFTETSPGAWWPAPLIKDRLVSNGNDFHVLREDGGDIWFDRRETGAGADFTLRQLSDDTGNTWSFDWADGRLTRITEPAGRWLKIGYRTIAAPQSHGPFTVISEVAASDGRSVAYDYDFIAGSDYPVLSKVHYPDGTRAIYTYKAPRIGDRLLMVRAQDPHGDAKTSLRGRELRYRTEADAATGQIETVVTIDGGNVLQELNADSQTVRSYAVRQDNGAMTYCRFNAGGNEVEKIDGLGYSIKYDYDADGRGFNIATTDQLGHTTRFENDPNGNVVKQTATDSTSRTWSRDERGRTLSTINELGNITKYTRDGNGRMTNVEYSDGSTVETSYNEFGEPETLKDPAGAVTTLTYGARGLPLRHISALGDETICTYDTEDRLAAVTDARGNTTRYERDAAGRVVKTIFADGNSIAMAYNEFGQITSTTDALGATRTMVYDAFGRLTSTIDSLGKESRTLYAALGKSGAPFDRSVGTVFPSGRATAMEYDANGRILANTIAVGTKEASTTRYGYDAVGRRSSITDPRGNTTQSFYDERGRRIKVVNGLRYATTFSYNAAGKKVSQTDPKGNITKWTYDIMGRELTKTDALNQVTRKGYDKAGRLIALIDANGNTNHFEYDLLGQPTAFVYPDNSKETTDYGRGGLKVRNVNRAGAVQTFAYDNRNREISSEWSDGSQRIVKAYDAAGRMIIEDNGVSQIVYTYDRAGRLASETQDLSTVVAGGLSDPPARTVHYSYTVDGQRETIGYPDHTLVKLIYNARGQLQSILGNGILPPIASYVYDAAGNATQMPRENLSDTVRTYDAANRVTSIADESVETGPLSKLNYTYDETDNRTSTTATAFKTSNTANTRSAFLYDATNQLTGVDYESPADNSTVTIDTPASTIRFTYDAVGNRIEVNEDGTVTHYSVNNLNQYTRIGEFTPTHDRNGNLAAMGRWLYRFDALNRLTSASNGTTTATFYYDAKNRCVARSYNESATLSYYDDWNLIAEYDLSGAQLARYVHGRRIDEIILIVNQRGTFYPHHDALGNVAFVTDTAGRIAEHYTYSVTGEVSMSDRSGNGLVTSNVGNMWLYTGRQWLPEIGLYNYRNRMYSAGFGRFLQTDPIRFDAGDVNIYRYVSNAYLSYHDPFGTDQITIVYVKSGTSSTDTQFISAMNGVTSRLNTIDSNNNYTLVSVTNITSAAYYQSSYNIIHGIYSGSQATPTNFSGNVASQEDGAISSMTVEGTLGSGNVFYCGMYGGQKITQYDVEDTIREDHNLTTVFDETVTFVMRVWEALWDWFTDDE